jgi:hypothetical protein
MTPMTDNHHNRSDSESSSGGSSGGIIYDAGRILRMPDDLTLIESLVYGVSVEVCFLLGDHDMQHTRRNRVTSRTCAPCCESYDTYVVVE